MSTLKVNRIEPRTGDTVEIVGFEAPTTSIKAWINFNGTGAVSIRGEMNVSSITDNGTGDYTINFRVAMSDANYAVAAASHLDSTVGSAIAVFDYTTSNVRIKTSTHNANEGSFQDQDPVSMIIFGN